jgi:hypothetical protein
MSFHLSDRFNGDLTFNKQENQNVNLRGSLPKGDSKKVDLSSLCERVHKNHGVKYQSRSLTRNEFRKTKNDPSNSCDINPNNIISGKRTVSNRRALLENFYWSEAHENKEKAKSETASKFEQNFVEIKTTSDCEFNQLVVNNPARIRIIFSHIPPENQRMVDLLKEINTIENIATNGKRKRDAHENFGPASKKPRSDTRSISHQQAIKNAKLVRPLSESNSKKTNLPPVGEKLKIRNLFPSRSLFDPNVVNRLNEIKGGL